MLIIVFLFDVLETFISTVYMYNIVIKNLGTKKTEYIWADFEKVSKLSKSYFVSRYNVGKPLKTFLMIQFALGQVEWLIKTEMLGTGINYLLICSLYNYYSVKFCSKNINM